MAKHRLILDIGMDNEPVIRGTNGAELSDTSLPEAERAYLEDAQRRFRHMVETWLIGENAIVREWDTSKW